MKLRPCSVLHCGAQPSRPYPFGWRCAAHAPPEPGGRYCAPRRCYCGTCPEPTGDCPAGVHPAAGRVWRGELQRWALYCTACGVGVGILPPRPAQLWTGR